MTLVASDLRIMLDLATKYNGISVKNPVKHCSGGFGVFCLMWLRFYCYA